MLMPYVIWLIATMKAFCATNDAFYSEFSTGLVILAGEDSRATLLQAPAGGTVQHSYLTVFAMVSLVIALLIAILALVHVRRKWKSAEALLKSAAENSLQQSSFIRAVFDTLEDSFYYKDRDSVILGGNAGWVRDRGVKSIDDLIGKTDLDIHPAPLGQQLYSMEQQQMLIGVTKRVLEEQRKPDGSVKFVESIKCPMRNEMGEVIGLAGISRDVTQIMLNERRLLESQKAAEAANQAKSDFLANISHETRTPINGVIGMVEILLESGLNEEQRGYAHTIKSSADCLLTIIDDVLSFANIEAGKIEVEAVSFGLPPLMSEIIQSMRVRARAKNLQVNFHIAPEVPSTLIGDPQKIRQILTHLIGNGVKFTEQGEVKVEVTAKPGSAGKCQCRFIVNDTGIGIPKDKLPDLFRRFHQVDSSTTRNYGGIGLGLATSRRLCELMGGSLAVTSEVGKGTQFSFILELGCAEDRIPVKESAPARKGCGTGRYRPAIAAKPIVNQDVLRRVLLVDDGLINLKVAGIWLQKLGHSVVTALDGEKAVEAFQVGHFDLILMDVQMPVLDGLEATRLIRQIERQRLTNGPTPIVAMTAHAMTGYRECCLEAGMNDYITKPIRREHLQLVLDRWL
jgi:PAS domain S-box-containing protein